MKVSRGMQKLKHNLQLSVALCRFAEVDEYEARL